MRKRGKDEGVMRSKNEGVMRMAVRFISVWSVCHIGIHAPLALPPPLPPFPLPLPSHRPRWRGQPSLCAAATLSPPYTHEDGCAPQLW